jgi:hypothetical protein
MFESFTSKKLKSFIDYASSPWTQKEAEALWNESLWKLNLKVEELLDIQDAWTTFIVNGDKSKFREIRASVLNRLG